MGFAIRRARLEDADGAVAVVRRSITELCAADHRGDADTLAQWLANKTPANFITWIANAENFCVVAEIDSRPACAFYETIGYRPAGAARPAFGVVQTYPYEKLLE